MTRANGSISIERRDALPGAGAANRQARRDAAPRQRGFSMLELTIAMAVLTVLMGAMMTFISRMQYRMSSEQKLAGVNQGGKTAMDLLGIDISQAGFPPVISTTTTSLVGGGAALSTVSLAECKFFYSGRPVIVDSGLNMEVVTLTSPTTPTACTSSIAGYFLQAHPSGTPIRTSAMPYENGILMSTLSGQDTSTGTMLKMFGDLHADGTLRYVEYDYIPSSGTTAGCLVRVDANAFYNGTLPSVTSCASVPGSDTSSPQNYTVATVLNDLWPDPNDPTNGNIFNYDVTMQSCPSLPYPSATNHYFNSCTASTAVGGFVSGNVSVPYIYVTNVGITLAMRTTASVEKGAGAGGQRQIVVRQQYFTPRNVVNSFTLAKDGVGTLLPVAPGTVTGILGQ